MRIEMNNKILVSLFIIFILGACSSPEEPKSTEIRIHIEGIVIDANNHMPIADAKIQLKKWEWPLVEGNKPIGCVVYDQRITNEEGFYSFIYTDSENCSRFKITPEAEGYREEYPLHFYATCPGPSISCTSEIQIFNFQLDPL